MNWLLLIAAFWTRPEMTPVSERDAASALRREAEIAQAVGVPAMSPWQAAAEDKVPGRFVVGFESGTEVTACAWVVHVGGTVVRESEGGGFIVADFPAAVSGDAALRQSAAGVASIQYFEPDIRVRAAHMPNDPMFLSYQWDKWVMYADKAWDVSIGSPAVRVAIIDCGVDYEHPDLAANFRAGDLGHDFIGNDEDPKPDDPNGPGAFHGSHVSGIAAAVIDNSLQVAGWAQVQLLAVRVLNDSGSGNLSTLADGIRWAADHGCRVANMSVAATSSTTPLEEAARYAESKNVLLVAASGNDGHQGISYPAALNECVAVGALGMDGFRASFSNYGSQQELIAPGVDIASTVPGGSIGLASGTSMASPQVAGVAALVLGTDTSLTAAKLRSILDVSAIDMGSQGRDIDYGYGLLNAKRALDLAATMQVKAAAVGSRTGSGAVVLRKGGFVVPDWAGRAVVYDCTGRQARIQAGRGFSVELGVGTWFVRLEGSGRSETRKLLVLD